MEGLGEDSEDLLWRAEVVEKDVMGEYMEGLDQLKDRK